MGSYHLLVPPDHPACPIWAMHMFKLHSLCDSFAEFRKFVQAMSLVEPSPPASPAGSVLARAGVPSLAPRLRPAGGGQGGHQEGGQVGGRSQVARKVAGARWPGRCRELDGQVVVVSQVCGR